MSKVVSSLQAVALLLISTPPEALATEYQQSFANGFEVRVLQGTGTRRMSVRVDTSVGIDAEEATSGGGAAAYLAALLNSGTPSYKPSGWAQETVESGLSLSPHLERDSSGFTLAGGIHLLERALWLAGERLGRLDLKEADIRKIRPAIFRGAESDKYHAITARGDEKDTLKHLLLGARSGRTDFESRLRALRLSSNDFRKAVHRLQERVKPKVTLVLPKALLGRGTTLARTYFESLPPLVADGSSETGSETEAQVLTEPIRGRFENPRDSASLVGYAWNLSQLQSSLGWSRMRLETTAEALVAVLAHPGGAFFESLRDPRTDIIDFNVDLTGTRDLALLLVATCQPKRFSTAKMAINTALRNVAGNSETRGDISKFTAHRVHALTSSLNSNENLASVAGALWTSKRLKTGERVGAWVTTYLEALRKVPHRDVTKLLGAILDQKGRAEATFVPSRSVRSREVGLTEEIMDIYARIVTDSRCPRPGIAKLKWTELLRRKYRMSAETYVRISQKITARARLMRRISKAADEQCEQYQRLRKERSYAEITSIHRAISCGPASIRDDDLRQKALKKVFRDFDLDPSLYRPLLSMAREDMTSRPKLQEIERRCPPKYGPGVAR